MALPAQLQKEFVAEFKREPHIVLRAICDLTGEDGLTWLACDGAVLACFSKPAGGEFTRHDYRIAEATTLEADAAEANLLLRCRFPETEFALRLPPSEDAALHKLVALLPGLDTVNTIRPPAALTPHLVCAGAAFALAQSDGDFAKEELDWVVAHFGNQNSFRRAGSWVNSHGFAKLLLEGARLLTPGELECVVFNLLELGFSDNKLSREELTMLEEWRQTAGLSEERYQRAYDALLAAASLGVLVNETPGGPDWTPINLLCAAVLAVIQHQPETAERRLKALERRVQSTDAINSGQTYVEQLGVDGLVTVLAEMLAPAQRRCVLANVLHEAWHDGEPPAEVGAYLRQLHAAFGVSAGDFEADTHVFRQVGDASLFREAPAGR
jgi:hypothetical protein